MPIIWFDTEQAELTQAAIVMMRAALVARSDRADPEKVITNSMRLQANKLASIEHQLNNPEPLDWAALPRELRDQLHNHMLVLTHAHPPQVQEQAYRTLKLLVLSVPTVA